MKKKGKFGLKGRGVDPKARAEIRVLLGREPRRRDLLIEHLHRIQDRYGHLSAAHLAALAVGLAGLDRSQEFPRLRQPIIAAWRKKAREE